MFRNLYSTSGFKIIFEVLKWVREGKCFQSGDGEHFGWWVVTTSPLKLSSVCLPYICLPVCCSIRCFGARSSLLVSVSDWASLMLNVGSTGGRVKTWKRRWFILTDNCLYYFEYTTVSIFLLQYSSLILTSVQCSYIFICFAGQRTARNHPVGEPEHQGGRGQEAGMYSAPCWLFTELGLAAIWSDYLSYPHYQKLFFVLLSIFFQNCFELYISESKDQVIKACKTEADGRVVEGNHTFYRISAPTAEEKEDWMNSIK